MLNLAFTLLEIIGGLLINSAGILSGALHDLGDSLSLRLAWYLQGVSERDEDANTPKSEIIRIRRASNKAIDNLHLEHITIAIEYTSENCAMRT